MPDSFTIVCVDRQSPARLTIAACDRVMPRARGTASTAPPRSRGALSRGAFFGSAGCATFGFGHESHVGLRPATPGLHLLTGFIPHHPSTMNAEAMAARCSEQPPHLGFITASRASQRAELSACTVLAPRRQAARAPPEALDVLGEGEGVAPACIIPPPRLPFNTSIASRTAPSQLPRDTRPTGAPEVASLSARGISFSPSPTSSACGRAPAGVRLRPSVMRRTACAPSPPQKGARIRASGCTPGRGRG